MNFLNLSEEAKDQNIYRIMPQAYVLEMFKDNKNVLTQIHKWKDKFENFQMNLGGTLNGENFEYSFRRDFVGQCWTTHSWSEAMWGIYANDPEKRFLRIRSTPRKLLSGLVSEHPAMPQDTCFIGKVSYLGEKRLKEYLQNSTELNIFCSQFAKSLLLKRRAFSHEREVRLLYFGHEREYDKKGLYRYSFDPHETITQIMADPNRDRRDWASDKSVIKKATGFLGKIKRSKIYDPPDWEKPKYNSNSPT